MDKFLFKWARGSPLIVYGVPFLCFWGPINLYFGAPLIISGVLFAGTFVNINENFRLGFHWSGSICISIMMERGNDLHRFPSNSGIGNSMFVIYKYSFVDTVLLESV